MPSNKNIEKLENLKKKVSQAKSIVFANYTGLDANNINKFRRQIKEADAEVTITKNTLLNLALKEEDKEVPEEILKDQTITIFGYEDAINPIKEIADFIEEFKLPVIKAGIVNGIFYNAEKIEELSKIPSKEELLGRLVGTLNSPISGFANAIGGVQRKFVYAIKAVADSKE